MNIILLANSGDPDQTQPSVASDLGLHGLSVSHKKVARLIWVKLKKCTKMKAVRVVMYQLRHKAIFKQCSLHVQYNLCKTTALKKGKNAFQEQSLLKVHAKCIAECSNGSILQYFRPSLSYHLSLGPYFCLFLSGRLREVLLYTVVRTTSIW